VMEVALEYGATIGHHHGVGKQRVPWIKREHGSSYILMTALKRMFDPKGIMNPGTLLEHWLVKGKKYAMWITCQVMTG
jgi:alkyldihydroxyacetonephosphate synthase